MERIQGGAYRKAESDEYALACHPLFTVSPRAPMFFGWGYLQLNASSQQQECFFFFRFQTQTVHPAARLMWLASSGFSGLARLDMAIGGCMAMRWQVGEMGGPMGVQR